MPAGTRTRTSRWRTWPWRRSGSRPARSGCCTPRPRHTPGLRFACRYTGPVARRCSTTTSWSTSHAAPDGDDEPRQPANQATDVVPAGGAARRSQAAGRLRHRAPAPIPGHRRGDQGASPGRDHRRRRPDRAGDGARRVPVGNTASARPGGRGARRRVRRHRLQHQRFRRCIVKFSVFTASTPDWQPAEAATILAGQGWDGIEWRVTDQDDAPVPWLLGRKPVHLAADRTGSQPAGNRADHPECRPGDLWDRRLRTQRRPPERGHGCWRPPAHSAPAGYG